MYRRPISLRRRPRSAAATVPLQAATHSRGALALLPLLAALCLLLLGVAGCRAQPDDAAGPPEPAAGAAAEPVEVRASVPIEGYRELDPERLEAERLDDSWRSVAERDRAARAAALRGEGTGTAGRSAPAKGAPETGAAGPAGEGTATTGDSGAAAGPGGPAGAGSAGRDGAQGSAAGTRSAAPSDAAAPVERMRSAGTAAGPAAGSRTGSDGGASAGTAGRESWDDVSPQAFEGFAPSFPIARDGGGPTVLALQRLLDRVRFSPGVIDGRWGKNTEKAVYWLQDALGLEPTGTPDRALWDRLAAEVGDDPPVRRHRLTAADLEGPFVEVPEEVGEQAELECLCHESPAEAVAERFHTTLELLAKLNPEADLDALAAGDEVWVPDVERFDERPGVDGRVASVVVAKDGFYLHALDDRGRLLYHFPSTVGAGYDPSPSGDLQVTATAWDPTFHYQPKLFAEVPDTDEDHLLPAGPNSPVGTVWMQLSKDNYGIHGTSAPETIGYATSHGCIRLTNWDAVFLAGRVGQGTPVEFRGGDGEGERQAGGAEAQGRASGRTADDE